MRSKHTPKDYRRDIPLAALGYFGAVVLIALTLWAASRVANLDTQLRQAYAEQHRPFSPAKDNL